VESCASMGAGMWFSGRGGVVGVSNHTNFLRASRSGTLSIEATPIHRGRTQQLWLVEISNEQGKAVARGEVRLANITEHAQIGG
jgi:1,4-dihydroxy-2-naphthoyl-CoA hydrolase